MTTTSSTSPLTRLKALYKGADLIAITYYPDDGRDEDGYAAISALKAAVAARIKGSRFEHDYDVETAWGVKVGQDHVLVFGQFLAGEKPEPVPLDTDLIEFDKRRKAQAVQTIRDAIGETEMQRLGIGHLLSHIK